MRQSGMMKKTLSITFMLLALYVVAMKCDDESTECTTGAACFPDGQMPFEVTPTTSAYYCCLQRNMTERNNRLPDKTYNCSCVLDLSLPSKILNWAVETRDIGRMCVRDSDCKHADVTTTVSEKFQYCCFGNGKDNVTSEVSWFDSDKEEFIGCRCRDQPVPAQDPQAYVVPPVPAYNSTDESCHYNAACLDHPALKCQSHWPVNVTFCCYGSRGLVTENDKSGNFTRCTCSDEVYGTQCEANPIAIEEPGSESGSESACLTDCGSVADKDKCADSSKVQRFRCCPHNMAVIASQSPEGNFISCTCKANATRTCDTSPSSFSAPCLGGRLSDVILLALAVLFWGRI